MKFRQGRSSERVTGFGGMSLSDMGRVDVAARMLGGSLFRGEITLLLGAGVSSGSHLPSWGDLVAGCEDEMGFPKVAEDRDPVKLMEAMEDVQAAVVADSALPTGHFAGLVRNNLYPKEMLAAGKYPDELLSDMMLIALGAMVMPCSRGSVADVITMNFDDVLEWYLEMHGFRTQSVVNLPESIRSDVDVRVLHAHGFLPLHSDIPATDWLVLTRREFVRRIAGTSGKAWPRFITNVLSTKVLLAVGTSMADLDVHVHLEEAVAERGTSNPIGYVVNKSFTEGEKRNLLGWGLVPVSIGSYEEIPHFLLEVCRYAARS